jgi:transforming growth factor-beta-induced protein
MKKQLSTTIRMMGLALIGLLFSANVTSQTILDIVTGSDDHSTLEAAVVAADLGGALSAPGELTLFAPTDAAFAALPAGTIDALLADPSGDLTQILLYHVVGAEAFSNSLTDGQVVTTLQGQDVTVTIAGSMVYINNAMVTVADIDATNGVVHVVDAVLLPEFPTNTVVDIIINSENHNTLEAAVIAAGLAETLSGDGPFTVFAPTDAAFAALPAGVIDALLADPTGQLTEILFYHVVSGTALSTDLFDQQEIVTLNGLSVVVTINGSGVFINDAQVTVADILADNGVVHVINAVLIPTEPTPTTVFDIISGSEVHNTLEAGLVAAGLDQDLTLGGPFTVFAPTDAAFEALPAGVLDALLADPSGDLTTILLYHVLSGTVLSTDLSDGQTATTLLGEDITVTIEGSNVFINDAQVIIADLVADNGVVHVIDAILSPAPASNTVVDIIVNSENHTTLEAAVIAAGLVETLSGDGPFTVFAPTDEAFAALPAGTIDALLADPTGLLTEILFYHVVSGTALSTDLSDQQEIVTINGLSVTVTINGSGVFINDAQVTVADIIADNGVVHVINAVLIPTEPTPTTVFDIIANSDVHTTLEAGLIASGLDQDLTLGGPFTVFAPTDAAFAALPAGVLDALLADPSGELTSILLYHVLSGTVLSTDLSDGQTATTLLGEDITVTINGSGVFINDAQVIIADLTADNGVVHVIDAILTPAAPVPATVWDIIVDSPDHTVLETAVLAAGLDDELSSAGPFTVFAPTDDAFAALPAGTIASLLANPTLLSSILLYHVASGNVLSGDLSDGQSIETLQGQSVEISIMGSTVSVNDADVIVADLVADNGVVHVIDGVLSLPVGINENQEIVASIFPNPTVDQLTITLANATENTTFQIIDFTGKVVEQGNMNSMIKTIDTSNLAAGNYMVRLLGNNTNTNINFIKL